MKNKLASLVRALLLIFTVGTAVEMALPLDAEARAGRSRSSGRVYRQQSTPPPGSSSFNKNPYAAPQQPAMNPNRGGFMRGLAGGLAGGFLGSMLFSSLGHASTGSGGGGIGLIEILLLAGAGYLLYRWWKKRQQLQQPAFAGMNRTGYESAAPSYAPAAPAMAGSQFRALAPDGISGDEASDIFFRVQGAWTRRDMSPVRDLLGPEIQQSFGRDIDDLKNQKAMNRLENISIRRTEVLSSWNEDGLDLSTVRFTANLLDYTVDEQSGRVIEGSDSNPVKFEEDWTFAKTPGSSNWQLMGIQQV